MTLRHASLAICAALLLAACGGGATGVVSPTPTPPPTGGFGTVSGTLTVSVAAGGPARVSGVGVVRGVRRPPPGGPQFLPDQLLVKFKPGVGTAQATDVHKQFGTQEIKRINRPGVSVLKITSSEAVQAVVARYRAHPAVQYAEPNFLRYLAAARGVSPQATPNDSFYGLQWHYSGLVNLPAAWDVTTGSALVVVAVIDTGILSGHPDLVGTTVAGFDFYGDDASPEDLGCLGPGDVSHGAHVAGTVAALTNNATGVAGVNWGGAGRTRIMPLRIFGNYGGQCTTTSADIIAAIYWAADHSARVVNMSFGGGGFSQGEQDAVTYAFNTGVILIAAAGNDSADCAAQYPAAYANVVGVAATEFNNNKAPYSNTGVCVDLAAPGGDMSVDLNGDTYPDGVLSTSGAPSVGNGYYFFQGTSMASPHVAGLAALLISKGITGPANIQTVMQTTATDRGAPGFDTTYGWGLINAAAAVGAPVPTNPMRTFSGSISGNTITVRSDMVTVANAITYARGLGVTLVVAAGNSGCTPPSTVLYPARNANVIAVSATTNTNALASYSSCGPEVDVAAPGGSTGAGVLSTTWSPSGGHVYASFQGTSMATPHVSGVAALIIAAGAATTPAAIQTRLESTATDLGAAGKDNEFGSGLINASSAVAGGSATSQLRIFSGVISGTTVTRQSDIVVVATNGTFTITNAQTGIKAVFAWQDFNGNGIVDTGDSYGTKGGVAINNGVTTTGVSVTVSRYSGPALTVN